MEGKDKNKIYPSRIPNHLWLYRQKRGYSQKEVAFLLGHKSTAHISEYERGRRMPSVKTALKLEIVFSIPLAFLYSDLYAMLKEEIQSRREKLLAERHE